MNKTDIETRTLSLEDVNLETRSNEDGSQITTIRGYAAVFLKRSLDLGGFTEQIVPGAFARALREKQDVVALVDHDPSKLLGRSKSGTLTLAEDDKGLLVSIDVPNTTLGRDTVESIRRKDISGMSFGFRTQRDKWDRDTKGLPLRTLLDVDLVDVSPVVFPAYPDTRVGVRSLADWQGEELQASNLEHLKARQRLTEIDIE